MRSFEDRIRKGNYPFFYALLVFILPFNIFLFLSDWQIILSALLALGILISVVAGDILRLLLSIKDQLEKEK